MYGAINMTGKPVGKRVACWGTRGSGGGGGNAGQALRGGRRTQLRPAALLGLILLVVLLAAWGRKVPRLEGRRAADTREQPSRGSAGSARHPNGAAQELLPLLPYRQAQAALEKRWGIRTRAAASELERRQQQQQQGSDDMRIPRILHHVSFYKIQEYLDKTAQPNSTLREQWAQSCRLMHPDWTYIHWDWDAAWRLVEKWYPDFVEVFAGMDSVIKRADMIRYVIMHAIGGLYLDTDVECFAPVDSWLAGYDVVLQSPGPTNGVLASVPGHPIWMEVLTELRQRWWGDHNRDVVEATGPGLVSNVFSKLPGVKKRREHQPWVGEHNISGGLVRVYPEGAFFHPCSWKDQQCHNWVGVARALGTTNLTQLAGYHRFSASWWGDKDRQVHRPVGLWEEKDLKVALGCKP